MSRHSDTIRLQHMRDHAQEAIDLVSDKERNDLDKNRLLQLALVRLIEIIGEAASGVTKESQEKYLQVPWPQVISTRNRLIHGYDMVDYDILWQTVQEDLPALLKNLQDMLNDEDG